MLLLNHIFAPDDIFRNAPGYPGGREINLPISWQNPHWNFPERAIMPMLKDPGELQPNEGNVEIIF